MSAALSVQPLFTPVRMGDLDLPNRIDGTAHPQARWVGGSRADRAAVIAAIGGYAP
jgi:hypothetical protein